MERDEVERESAKGIARWQDFYVRGRDKRLVWMGVSWRTLRWLIEKAE